MSERPVATPNSESFLSSAMQRRSLLKASAWAAPVVAVAVGAPAYASSGDNVGETRMQMIFSAVATGISRSENAASSDVSTGVRIGGSGASNAYFQVDRVTGDRTGTLLLAFYPPAEVVRKPISEILEQWEFRVEDDPTPLKADDETRTSTSTGDTWTYKLVTSGGQSYLRLFFAGVDIPEGEQIRRVDIPRASLSPVAGSGAQAIDRTNYVGVVTNSTHSNDAVKTLFFKSEIYPAIEIE